jgi:hypothetical protein
MTTVTIAEAMDLTGFPYGSIVNACYSGRLRARKLMVDGYDKKPMWIIDDVDDLHAWAGAHIPRPHGEAWSDADDAALLELKASCTDAQLATYLERTVAAVKSRLKRLYENDLAERRNPQSLLPFQCPVTGIWVAKTCPYCGKLRDASQYTFKANRQGKRYPLTGFHSCGLAALRARGLDRRPKTERKRLRDATLRKKLQDVTRDHASKWHQEYTDTDLETLMDKDKSSFQVALELGRTYAGVSSKRSGMGFRRDRSRKEYGHWIIHFPEAMQALQERFRQIGEPVPEVMWDWNDDAA